MESRSEPNRIHCSEAAANLLSAQAPSMSLTARGVINVKGKGLMRTFWVNDHDDNSLQEDPLVVAGVQYTASIEV